MGAAIFQTLIGPQGRFAIVRKGDHFEFIVSTYQAPVTPNNLERKRIGTYFTDDRDDACGTAIAEAGL